MAQLEMGDNRTVIVDNSHSSYTGVAKAGVTLRVLQDDVEVGVWLEIIIIDYRYADRLAVLIAIKHLGTQSTTDGHEKTAKQVNKMSV